MKFNFIRKELYDYIINKIKPMYKNFDKAHNISHYNFVTNNCVNYAKSLKSTGECVDLEIAYVVGAFHDVGISKGREGHAKFSGEIVREDKTLKHFFNEGIIELIAQAVEDHSSHLSYEPRSVYGKIVADADRNNTLYLVFSRPIKFGVKNERYRDKSSHVDSVYDFVNKKFGINGYVKYWLDIPETRKEQLAVWELLDDEVKCKMYIEGLFDEITKGKYKQKTK